MKCQTKLVNFFFLLWASCDLFQIYTPALLGSGISIYALSTLHLIVWTTRNFMLKYYISQLHIGLDKNKNIQAIAE